MLLSWQEIQQNATKFSKRWETARREKADEQPFIIELLGVFGVEDPVKVGERQKDVKVKGESTKWIDYFWKNKIAVEMKSKGEDLEKAYWQLKERYMDKIDPEEVPNLWLVCDFENFHLFRMSTKEVTRFKLKDLRKHIKKFADIAGYETERIQEDKIEVNVKAAEKMAKLHDGLKAFGFDGHNLELYLVRLLFCMFADDTGIFKGSFFRYIDESKEDGSDLSFRIFNLFDMLNTDEDTRRKRRHLTDLYNQFRYINGDLFKEPLPPADFNAKMRGILLDCINFNWEKISPAIFGAMFQGVMDAKQRREFGVHYTSEENILKLINPLFMDELWAEFDKVKTNEKALDAFHNKIARLKFLDPACGCGNFLIITYRELRTLELEVLKMKFGVTDQRSMIQVQLANEMRVSVEQFYGIEVENFPCQIAQVGMWLIDHQMNMRVSDEFGEYYARLPLSQSATIVNANALRIDWESVVSKYELSYILGNPPFVGYKYQTDEQRVDMQAVYLDSNGKPLKTAGKIDYVAAWYYKAAKYLQNTHIRAALVSTNSITQGEQVTSAWKPLFDMFGIHIDFAYRTFKWQNEAKGKAAVHCIIVGFSVKSGVEKVIYDGEEKIVASNISPYLIDAPNVFIENRKKPLHDVPELTDGNRPTDGGNLIIEGKDYDDFIASEPSAIPYIKRYMMAREFLHNEDRYCLWLVGCPPNELKKMPNVMKRIDMVRQFRQASTKKATQNFAETPTVFQEIRHPSSDYAVIPFTSSERRKYIPIGFLTSDTVAGAGGLFIVHDATLYHFGILTSNVHMAWTRAVCGRLKSDYRYSSTLVYNNFPWPQADEKQQAEIEKLAQAVLYARANYPDSSLADLYDPLTMPPDLLKAHQNLDRAVMKLYGFPIKNFTEADCVAALMELYQKLTEINSKGEME